MHISGFILYIFDKNFKLKLKVKERLDCFITHRTEQTAKIIETVSVSGPNCREGRTGCLTGYTVNVVHLLKLICSSLPVYKASAH